MRYFLPGLVVGMVLGSMLGLYVGTRSGGVRLPESNLRTGAPVSSEPDPRTQEAPSPPSESPVEPPAEPEKKPEGTP